MRDGPVSLLKPFRRHAITNPAVVIRSAWRPLPEARHGTMRICIDIQAGVAQRAGVGRYTRMLAEHLDRLATSDELRLFYFDFQRHGAPFPVRRARLQACRIAPGRLVQRAWRAVGWPPFDWFAGAADVYHFPNFIRPPLSRGKSVVTVHDASFARFPEFAEPRNLRYLQARIADTLRRADAVITDAAFGARELQELFGVPPERLHAIHLGIGEEIVRPPAARTEAVRRELGLTRPYLLTVGTVEPRKNIPFLVDVFERLDRFGGDLVIAGMPGWKYEPILDRMRHSSRASRVQYVRYVADDRLPALYAGAEAFLCASRYEGFGFPPLEAMACGVPVVSSDGGSLGEVLGDGAVVIPDFGHDRWIAEIERVLGDAGHRERLSDAGRRRASAYRWEDTARRTLEVYRTVGAAG